MRPQRLLLTDQTADLLRTGISTGRWKETLPSESELCRDLHISRNTLRGAIAQLARENWLTLGGKGRRHAIRRVAKVSVVKRGHIVRLLSPYSLPVFGAANNAIMEKLGELLSAKGYRLEYEHRPTLFAHFSEKQLKRLDNLPDTAGWILVYATEAMQRWFADSGKACLNLGSVYPGVNLPSVITDGNASVEHAAKLFHQRGHRNMVYFIEAQTSYTDRLAAEGFVAAAKRLGATAKAVTYASGARHLRKAIASALAMRPRPTAIYSSSPESCLTIVGLLTKAGLRFPEDVELIAGSEEWFLQYTVPTIAHYRYDDARVARQGARILLDLLERRPGKQRYVRIPPRFTPGETLGPLAR